MPVLRPWLAALALVACALIALGVYAWTVEFRAPDIVGGLGRAAAGLRLEAIAMSLHLEAAEMRREEVRRLRAENAAPARRQAARFALANDLRAAALLAEAEGNTDRASEWLTEASRAAPERVDLICLLTDLRTRAAGPNERRMELLRLVYRHDSPCANLLAGQSFLDAADPDAARSYLERAAADSPDWAEPHLALARLDLRAGDLPAARARAAHALAQAEDLPSRLQAAAIIRAAGGAVPPPWQLIAQWAWRGYAWLLPAAVAFVVLLVSPALADLARRAVAWIRSQRGMAESAS